MKTVFAKSLSRLGIVAVALSLGFSATCLAGCNTSSSVGENCWVAPSSVLPAEPIKASLVQSASTYRAAYGFEELWENADVVCTASFQDASDSFMIEPLNGADPMYFTDFFFTDVTLFKGSVGEATTPGQQSLNDGLLTVRQRGGMGDQVATANDIAASFISGSDYLMFLYRIGGGSEYNTQGDHLYLIGGQMGAWSTTSEGVFASSIDSETATSAELQEQASLTPQIASGGITSDVATPAEKRITELDDQHDAGEITDEYYAAARAAAVLEATGFARILSNDEALAAENELISRAAALYGDDPAEGYAINAS